MTMMIENTDIPQISNVLQLAKDSVVMAALVVIMALGLIVYKQIIKPGFDQRLLIATKETETSQNLVRVCESLERTTDKLEANIIELKDTAKTLALSIERFHARDKTS